MIISVAMTMLMGANARQKSVFWRFTGAIAVIQLKRALVTPTLIAALITRFMVQIVQMIARRTRSVKMVKCVRGRTITVHLTTDTVARCHSEHMPKVYIPLLTTCEADQNLERTQRWCRVGCPREIGL